MFAHIAASRPARGKVLAAALAAVLIAGWASGPAQAADDEITVGYPQTDDFTFAPLAIGQAIGLFKKHDLKLTVQAFPDSNALEDALAKGTVQIALGSGTEFAFIPKGAPDTAVATLAVRPSLLVVSARPDTGIKAANDLKGRSVGVTKADPLPAWLVETLSKDKGWGQQGIKAVPLDEPLVSDGAINAKVESIVTDMPQALVLESTGQGHTVVNFGDVVKNFPFYVAFARNDLIANDQDAVKNFLTSWFKVVKWMADNRGDAIKRVTALMKTDEATATKLYDKLMPAYSQDGKFDQDALKTLAKALVSMKVLDREQDLGRYIKTDIMGSSCEQR